MKAFHGLQWVGLLISSCAVSVLLIKTPARGDFEDAPAVSEPSPLATATGAVQGTSPANPSLPEASPVGAGKGASTPTGTSSQLKPSKSANGKAKLNQNAPATAGEDTGLQHNSSAPVAYSAQSLEGSLTQGRILLKGDVQIEQADAVMKADVAELFSPKGATSPNRAVAKGRVSLNKSATPQSAELRAVANELEYFMPIRKVILKGKPKIWRGRELLQGDVIEVFLDTNEIKVRGARGVMDPAANASPVGNQGGSGVQNPPAKKSSQSGRR
ncbi:hypothetical protein EBU99_10815 [bacterium]|nr:hypothetical protein [bacterium]